MTKQSYNWQNEFLQCLELGTTNERLADRFEEIVELMKGSTGADSRLIKLTESHSQEWLMLRYEEFLDRLFVSELAVANAFPSRLTSEKGKLRFRQLMRVFHPDRGAHEQAWLNYRAERINKAYKKYQEKTINPIAVEVSIPNNKASEPSQATSQKSQAKPILKYKPNALRQTFGNAEQVQKRIVYGLFFLASILVFLVYLSSSGPSISSDYSKSTVESASLNRDDFTGGEVLSSVSPKNRVERILSEAPWLEADEEIVQVDLGEPLESERKTHDEANFSSFDTGVLVSNTPPASKDYALNKKLDSDLNVGSIDKKNSNFESKVQVRVDKNPIFKSNPDTKSFNAGKNIDKTSGATDSSTEERISTIPKAPPNRSKPIDRNKTTQWTNVSKNTCDIELGELLPILNENMKVITSSNMRKGPNVGCPIVASIAVGEEAKVVKRVLQKDGQWFELLLSRQGNSPSIGWVYGELLDVVVEKVSQVKLESEVTPNQSKKKNKDILNLRLEEVMGLLGKLQRAYESGDAELLASLYTSRGRENFIIAQNGLKRYYKWHFPKTKARKIQFDIDTHEFVSPTEVRLKGTASTSYKFVKNDRSKSRTASAKFIVVKVGGVYKIKSFDWKKI